MIEIHQGDAIFGDTRHARFGSGFVFVGVSELVACHQLPLAGERMHVEEVKPIRNGARSASSRCACRVVTGIRGFPLKVVRPTPQDKCAACPITTFGGLGQTHMRTAPNAHGDIPPARIVDRAVEEFEVKGIASARRLAVAVP